MARAIQRTGEVAPEEGDPDSFDESPCAVVDAVAFRAGVPLAVAWAVAVAEAPGVPLPAVGVEPPEELPLPEEPPLPELGGLVREKSALVEV